jgi:peroxiredoxin
MFCRELLARFERARGQFHSAGVRAIAVGMCHPEEAAGFCGRRAPSVTCLCDPSTGAYAAYGLRSGRLLEVTPPAVVPAIARALAHGHLQGRTRGDPMMMPGTFAIDAAGVLHAVHYARHAGDQPDLAAMIAAVRPVTAGPTE